EGRTQCHTSVSHHFSEHAEAGEGKKRQEGRRAQRQDHTKQNGWGRQPRRRERKGRRGKARTLREGGDGTNSRKDALRQLHVTKGGRRERKKKEKEKGLIERERQGKWPKEMRKEKPPKKKTPKKGLLKKLNEVKKEWRTR
ncbi:hypothetical protein, partial [Pasteurella multocida]|uniref:hypothetical protein n=1 Tax=Pasteurella multocida TaxID=747 RepID=UPI0017BA71CB